MNKNLKSKKLNTNKGITLIALIITIIVLLILAVVAIRAVQGDGILAHARNARDDYQAATTNEQETLQNYTDYIAEQITGTPTNEMPKVADNKGKVLSKDGKTELQDTYGNKVVVPAGFKIIEESPNEVTGGIVIEDVEAGTDNTKGSQFVWIPVGEIKKDAVGATEDITLGRYTFVIVIKNYDIDEAKSTGTPRIIQPKGTNSYEKSVALQEEWYGIDEWNYTYSEAPNAAFTSSAINNGGYYIGRYEARTNSATERKNASEPLTVVTCKKENAVYNYVTQPQALNQSQAMYSEKTFKSDLMNSYAWDTAIVFIQKFGTNNKYSTKTSTNTSFSVTGTTDDVECNIYDMASNCIEWTTENSNDVDEPVTLRGGIFDNTSFYTAKRENYSDDEAGDYLAFRPILYL